MEKRVGPLTCWHCEHFCFDGGTSDYSEYTPGEPPSIGCHRYMGETRVGHYMIERPTEEEFREAIMRAEICPDFKERER